MRELLLRVIKEARPDYDHEGEQRTDPFQPGVQDDRLPQISAKFRFACSRVFASRSATVSAMLFALTCLPKRVEVEIRGR
jgi:hypothetical protein